VCARAGMMRLDAARKRDGSVTRTKSRASTPVVCVRARNADLWTCCSTACSHPPSIMLLTHVHLKSTFDRIADRITTDNNNNNSNGNSNSVVCASSVILTLSSCISNRANQLNAERDQERP